MRGPAVAALALMISFAPFALPARGELPGGRGVLLPLRDRVGQADLAELAETLLRRELGAHAELVEAGSARAVLRSMRVRDASNEAPERLAELAGQLGADWLFLPALHEATVGREQQREDGGAAGDRRIADGGDTPQLVLSARVLQGDSSELWWAGFVGASGRDSQRAFGLREIETLEDLMESTVKGLVARAVEPREARPRTSLRTRGEGFLRAAGAPSAPDRVAVIPMDSVAVRDASASAEVATAALFAALDDFGFKTLVPGLVQAIRQESGQIQHGAVSRSEWEALAREAGASWVATGTVETYRRGQGWIPDPWVAFSIRFLDSGDGRIAWSDGLERSGRDTGSAFDRGRIYSTGGLTYEMMRALFGELQVGPGTGGASRRK
jgi:hypothetical protein